MCKINKTTKKIVLPNKAEILFKPLDDEHKVKSINGISLIWLWVLEEASDLDKEMYNQLENRLRAPEHLLPGFNQQLILSFNPVWIGIKSKLGLSRIFWYGNRRKTRQWLLCFKRPSI